MTKILLVEKRYDGTEENPSVTAKWIEVPDGEEELFLAKQIEGNVDIFSKKDYFSIGLNNNISSGIEVKSSFLTKLGIYLEYLQKIITPIALSVSILGLIIYSVFFDRS
jgi:hypothetical protein